jgi:hypothetical protein
MHKIIAPLLVKAAQNRYFPSSYQAHSLSINK